MGDLAMGAGDRRHRIAAPDQLGDFRMQDSLVGPLVRQHPLQSRRRVPTARAHEPTVGSAQPVGEPAHPVEHGGKVGMLGQQRVAGAPSGSAGPERSTGARAPAAR